MVLSKRKKVALRADRKMCTHDPLDRKRGSSLKVRQTNMADISCRYLRFPACCKRISGDVDHAVWLDDDRAGLSEADDRRQLRLCAK